ncbi:SusD/RagB family nutrient-binding outer membrane lipoprotein [Rufibacter hautae]|uniref:SusD/RagB family nutrient-binding outer membrane lipoprotein n=1 Tax=Rufibacter hautae TaxID=2595005 RepID=A0A5B6TBU3_9BACT|nr:SusD/RagB family nutrient-binding outer membrane lipoprotein [Rufibacter hautae]KAA3436449.1 SusD/RagB family nutrient-binding outer membrane lipoprotein [Rufibacter hautae]
MKRILYFCIPALLFATSCVDSLDDYNINTKAATQVPGATLVTSAERSLANIITSSSVNNNPFRFYAQYWAATTYPDESQFVIATRQVDRNFWDPFYRDVLRDLKEAKTIITANNLLDPKIKANQLASIEVLEVYAWSVLVNTFGDVPYSEALDINQVLPKYDDDAAIYADLTVRLDKAIGMFDATATGLGTADLIYSGNVPNWIKFANSLKLRLGMTLADVDPAKAKTMVEAAAPNVIMSNAESADITYLATTPNTNPVWTDLVQSGRADFVGANTIIDRMNTLNDPRRNEYFKPLENGTFKGGTYGAPNSYSANSAPGTILESPTNPGMLLSYSEVEFLLAEAVERGFAVGGTAMGHYNAGITASITEWGGTETEAAAYILQPGVNYLTAPGDYKQKIGTQKWISLYSNPVEGWKEWRRLDAPSLVKPALGISEIPLRLTYPTTEFNSNGDNAEAASSAIGGNTVTSKIFWDKF